MSLDNSLDGPKFVQLVGPVLAALRTLGGSACRAGVVRRTWRCRTTLAQRVCGRTSSPPLALSTASSHRTTKAIAAAGVETSANEGRVVTPKLFRRLSTGALNRLTRVSRSECRVHGAPQAREGRLLRQGGLPRAGRRGGDGSAIRRVRRGGQQVMVGPPGLVFHRRRRECRGGRRGGGVVAELYTGFRKELGDVHECHESDRS